MNPSCSFGFYFFLLFHTDVVSLEFPHLLPQGSSEGSTTGGPFSADFFFCCNTQNVELQIEPGLTFPNPAGIRIFPRAEEENLAVFWVCDSQDRTLVRPKPPLGPALSPSPEPGRQSHFCASSLEAFPKSWLGWGGQFPVFPVLPVELLTPPLLCTPPLLY